MGTSNQRNQTVEQWLAQFGYSYNANDPFAGDYAAIINAAKPSAVPGGAGQPGYGFLCEACLRARAILYYKSSPGDCGTTPPAQATPNEAASVGGSLASSALSFIPGVGAIIGAIEGIFAEHAQAVANEENTLCSVSTNATAAIKQIDAAVAGGQITPAQGIAAMQQVVTTANQGLATIEKTPSDAAAYYVGVMQAQAGFAQIYYPALAPTGATAVGDTISNWVASLSVGDWLLIGFGGLAVVVVLLFAYFEEKRR
jgi:hypothetical protein